MRMQSMDDVALQTALEPLYKQILSFVDPLCHRGEVEAAATNAARRMVYATGGYALDPVAILLEGSTRNEP